MSGRILSAGLRPGLLLAAAYAGGLYLDSRTDDASVEGPVVAVSARVAGPVLRVLVRDHEEVRAGQLLLYAGVQRQAAMQAFGDEGRLLAGPFVAAVP